MSNILAPYKPNQELLQIAVKTSPALTTYLNALDSPLVKDSDDNAIKAALSQGINSAIFIMGHPSKGVDELSMMINELLRDVKFVGSTLTLSELVLMCQNGSKEAYGQNFGVNVSTINKWMMGMIGDMKRQAAKKSLYDASIPKEETPKEVSDQEWIRLSIEAFDKFKKSGVYEDWGNIIYLFLERKGLLNYSNERKAEIKEIVQNRELQRLSAPLSMEEKRSFERLKDQLLSGSMDLKGKCRREALLIYFAELAEMEISLEDLLND